MTRRKGELTRAAIDRGWPHQVIVPALGTEIWASRWPSMCPRRLNVVQDDRWHAIYCFADPADADDFCRVYREFGARPIDPRTRGRGASWHLLKEPKNEGKR